MVALVAAHLVLIAGCVRSGFETSSVGGSTDGWSVSTVEGAITPPGSIATNRFDVAAAANGQGYAVVWVGVLASGSGPEVLITLLDRDGQPRERPRSIYSLGPTELGLLLIFAAPSGYVVFLKPLGDGNPFTAIRIDDAAAVVDSSVYEGTYTGGLQLTSSPDGFRAVYQHGPGFAQLYTRDLDPWARSIGPERRLEPAEQEDQRGGQIVWTGSRFAVVWHDGSSSKSRLAWADRDGGLLAPSTEPSDNGTVHYGAELHLALLGTDSVLLTWRTAGHEYASLLDIDGPVWESAVQPLPLSRRGWSLSTTTWWQRMRSRHRLGERPTERPDADSLGRVRSDGWGTHDR
jgi:hypothetical protein